MIIDFEFNDQTTRLILPEMQAAVSITLELIFNATIIF